MEPPQIVPVMGAISATTVLFSLYAKEKREGVVLLDSYARFCDQHKISCRAKQYEGHIETVLCNVVNTPNCKVLVMGNHGKSAVDRFFLGSTSLAMLHASPVPVVIVKSDPDCPTSPSTFLPPGAHLHTVRRIAVAVDSSAASRAAIDWTVANLLRCFDHLYIVHISKAKWDEQGFSEVRDSTDLAISDDGCRADSKDPTAFFMEQHAARCAELNVVHFRIVQCRSHKKIGGRDGGVSG